jgi:hypothetical protein
LGIGAGLASSVDDFGASPASFAASPLASLLLASPHAGAQGLQDEQVVAQPPQLVGQELVRQQRGLQHFTRGAQQLVSHEPQLAQGSHVTTQEWHRLTLQCFTDPHLPQPPTAPVSANNSTMVFVTRATPL